MSAAEAEAARMVTAADPGRTSAYYTELQAAADPASLAAAIVKRIDPLLDEARDDATKARRAFDEALERVSRLEELAAAARAVDAGETDASVILRGHRIADAAIQVARDAARSELHYREWFDLVRQAGYIVGGADPLASFLTALHRHAQIESLGHRTGVWRVPSLKAA